MRTLSSSLQLVALWCLVSTTLCSCTSPVEARPSCVPVAPRLACARPCPQERKMGSVVHVIDGDSFRIVVELGYDVSITTGASLQYVDTPELYMAPVGSEQEAEAQAARDFVLVWLGQRAKTVWIWGGMRKSVSGGWLIDICDTVTDECLSDALLEAGHGKER